MKHPGQEDLLEFAAGQAAESVAEGIYAHLAECDVCVHRLQAIRNIRSNFDASWEEFVEEARSAREQETAQTGEAGWTLAVRVRGFIDRTLLLATAAKDRTVRELQGLGLEVNFVPAYAGVADSSAHPETTRLILDASEECSRGNDPQARTHLMEASRLSPDAGSSARLDLYHQKTVVGQVLVDARSGKIVVLVHPDHLEPAAWAAVLELSGDDSPTVERKPLKQVEGARYLLAEFEDLVDGNFSVGIEKSSVQGG